MPDYLLIDAMQLDVLIEQKSLIKGDMRSVSIAAASILAKTHRDARMEEWDAVYPQYGLARHKGYATPDHLEALRGMALRRCTAIRLLRCASPAAGQSEQSKRHCPWIFGHARTKTLSLFIRPNVSYLLRG